MNREAEDNPYAPPASDQGEHQPQEPGQVLWRIEDDKLFVRPGAVLPEICLWDGTEGSPGSWTLLAFRAPEESITVFQSRPTLLKVWCMLLGGPVLGTGAGVLCSILMVGDDSATTASIFVSFTVMILGAAVPLWLLRKRPEIVDAETNGWHEVLNVSPTAIVRLQELQDRSALA